MEVPLISIAYIIIGLICLLKLKWIIKFAIIALPLTTVALLNVYMRPTFAINLSQYGIILLFVYLMLRKIVKKEDYVSIPRILITMMSLFILFIPISWIATTDPNLYAVAYIPLLGIYTTTSINFSAQHISKAIYAIFGFFVFIVSFKLLPLCNFRVIARTFVFSGFLMALFGLFDFVFPFQMEGLRGVLLPANASMGSFGYGPVIGLGGVQRAYGLMWEAGGLAEYLLGAFFFMLSNLILGNVIFGRLKDRLLLLSLAIVTILTGSTAIVVAILLFPVMLFLIPSLPSKRRILRMWTKGIGIALTLVLIIWSLSFVFPSNVKYFSEWTLYKLKMASEIGGGAREGGSLELLKIFPQSPVIGLGLGSVGTECSIYGAGLLMLLVNVGIVGTLLYLLVMIFTVKTSVKMLRDDGSEIYPFRVGFLWAFVLVASIELVGRGLSILHAPHLWFLAGACIAIAQQSTT
jgi:hypothetical protein